MPHNATSARSFCKCGLITSSTNCSRAAVSVVMSSAVRVTNVFSNTDDAANENSSCRRERPTPSRNTYMNTNGAGVSVHAVLHCSTTTSHTT